jgi:acetoin:2,6-dichlorophenolindophenol oxidoreductase subunit alpha
MKDHLLSAYTKMVSIRVAEEEIAKYYLANKVMSFVHFYVGQEAVAVGVCDALTTQDRVMGNHRSHGHYLAKGGDLKRMVSELLGRENGLAKGKGGSMHMIDTSVGFAGSTPILGSVVPLANGSAFEQKYNNKKEVTVAFCGDGAFEEGVVYETLNLAALFKLPFLLVIENNLYSVNSKLRDRRSEKHDVEKIVTGFGVRYVKADGNDYEDVYTKTQALVTDMKSGAGPAVLECVTYRHMAHSAPLFDDAQGYREEDVLEKRLEQDSIKRLKNTLMKQGVIEAVFVEIGNVARAQALEAIRHAEVSPYPPKEDLYKNLYV